MINETTDNNNTKDKLILSDAVTIFIPFQIPIYCFCISVESRHSLPMKRCTGSISAAIVHSVWRFYVHFRSRQPFPRRICPTSGACHEAGEKFGG